MMAIEYCLLLKSNKLSNEILAGKIESLGYLCNNIEFLEKGICINLNNEIGFSIFLINTNNSQYNSWETNFMENEFEFERSLKFRMTKDYFKFKECYSVMLRILFDLVIDLNEEAIFINNGDTELCIFRENRTILVNNENGIWESCCFKDIIEEKKYGLNVIGL